MTPLMPDFPNLLVFGPKRRAAATQVFHAACDGPLVAKYWRPADDESGTGPRQRPQDWGPARWHGLSREALGGAPEHILAQVRKGSSGRDLGR
jgi:hypothetical protein